MAYDPEKNREYLRKRYADQRADFYARLGGVCAVCGTDENLQIDHVDRKKKSFNIGRLWPAKDLPKAYKELKKCQLLCEPHHIEKTAREQAEDRAGTFTHGSVYAWMKAKCTCPVCEDAKWAWHDARNAKRRKPGNKSRGRYNTDRAAR